MGRGGPSGCDAGARDGWALTVFDAGLGGNQGAIALKAIGTLVGTGYVKNGRSPPRNDPTERFLCQ